VKAKARCRVLTCARVCLVHKGGNEYYRQMRKRPQIFFYEKRKEKDEMYDVVTRDIIFIK